jgi:four helix bundle protein
MAFRFLNFKIYNDSKIFYKDILDVINKLPKEERYSLADQLRRAGLSIILNIAEGCDKGTDKDFNRYLMNSLGSLNEVVAAIDIVFESKYINKENYNKLINSAEQLSKQIGGFSKKLKNS